MPLLLGEQPIVEAITEALTDFKANIEDFTEEIFAYASDAQRAEIVEWWSDTENQVDIEGGYPAKQIVVPKVSVTIENDEEVDQFIGSSTGIVISGSDLCAANFKTAFHCHCFGINQNMTIWLQTLVKWSLLYKRKALQLNILADDSQTGYFTHQTLSSTGFMPVPENLHHDGLFPFERIVVLRTQHVDTWLTAATDIIENTNAGIIAAGG